jgi:hypothetical protein
VQNPVSQSLLFDSINARIWREAGFLERLHSSLKLIKVALKACGKAGF